MNPVICMLLHTLCVHQGILDCDSDFWLVCMARVLNLLTYEKLGVKMLLATHSQSFLTFFGPSLIEGTLIYQQGLNIIV